MARISFDPLAPQAGTQAANPLADLDRLLGRLQQTILRADAERERRLRSSEYERQKLAFVRRPRHVKPIEVRARVADTL